MNIKCDCINEAWLQGSHCPFYLECLDDMGYVIYTLLIRDQDGQVVGYRNVLERYK